MNKIIDLLKIAIGLIITVIIIGLTLFLMYKKVFEFRYDKHEQADDFLNQYIENVNILNDKKENNIDEKQK